MAEQTTTKNPKRDKALREAYAVATKRVRELHRDEFEQIYTAEAAARGETYTPKPKPVDKAADQMSALMTEFPELKERFGLTEKEPSDPPTAADLQDRQV